MVKEQLIENIRGSASERNEAVHYLLKDVKLKSRISSFILNNTGDSDDVKMIFHDAIIAFIKYVIKHPEFEVKQSYESYLLGIARNLWVSELRKKKLKLSTHSVEDFNFKDAEALSIDLILKGERKSILMEVLNKMRSRCREVLLYWADGHKMKEIADHLGYKSDGMVRKKKSECLKEIYNYLKEHPAVVNQLRNR